MAKLFVTPSVNPFVNAATEEYFTKHYPGDDDIIIYLWRNDNTVVIGRNQNAYREINSLAVQTDHVNVFRRFSGGGAVYQDLGNLCYTIIGPTSQNSPNAYAALAEPIIAFLKHLGVPAAFVGRNDLEINGLKFSGNAQYVWKNKLCHHGTLMFSVDPSLVAKYLNVDPLKIQTKGIDSVRKRITNIIDHIPHPEQWNIDRFIAELKAWFINEAGAKEITLSDDAWAWINNRAQTHFAARAWTYGNPDVATFHSAKRFAGGGIETYLKLSRDGKIENITFRGDFLSVTDLTDLTTGMIGLPYERDVVLEYLTNRTDFAACFGTLTPNEVLVAMFDNA